ncbi:hypothetical protein BCR39DRAFT_593015 [Naematelia encephala]|uniref:Uncharacterized protein n=1 Tax=Naematelia encephala TaxID=71784 RepID=A0A1Y2BCH4_9TREE|nr:hypothetical protein BCR39DRAFT_593015 [Naematelia encephala]
MSDPRFARLKTDPRFRRPKQKNLKVEIDERFRAVLESDEFAGSSSNGKGKAVDKRGRPLVSSHQADQLKRFYRLRSPSPSSSKQDGDFVDYARGEGVLESSGSEDEDSDAESEVEEEELELGQKKKRLPHLDIPEDSDSESEGDDEHLKVDLSEDDHVSAFPPEAESDDQEEEDEEDDVPTIPPTKRIAAVNLDWDNLRAADLFSVFNSFLSAPPKRGESSATGAGKLVDVRIYPSEFGKQRMEKEEQEGPAGGIFIGKAKRKDKRKEGIVLQKHLDEGSDEEDEGSDEEDEEDDDMSEGGDKNAWEGNSVEDVSDFDDAEDEDEDEQGSELEEDHRPRSSGQSKSKDIDGLEIVSDFSETGENDVDMDKLRQYQLERLRYYYAVATFSTVSAAEKVMSECNGTEFERTANVFDLSYVPDEMEFEDDEVTDRANQEIKGYKGNDFVTDALRHSKVKLTWDQDDPNRVKVTRRNLTREEIEEQDFKDYIASSDDEPTEDERDAAPKEVLDKKAKKASTKERTEKLRNLLLAGNPEDGDIWGKAGTDWVEELKEKPKSQAKVNGTGKSAGEMEITFKPALSTAIGVDEKENMTSLERYQLRMKEKKARKKEKAELRRLTKDEGDGKTSKAADDFFGEEDDNDQDIEPGMSSDEEGEGEEEEEVSHRVEKDHGGKQHFSMKDILKAEKESAGKRKRKRNKKKSAHADEREIELGPDEWKIDTKDDRFKALHEEPEFAIDPSNPHFTKTKAMKELLAERTRIRNAAAPKDVEGKRTVVRNLSDETPKEKDLGSLVESVKRRMEVQSKGKKRSRKH